jgi:L,D-transpeptidase ErfK/SrfK
VSVVAGLAALGLVGCGHVPIRFLGFGGPPRFDEAAFERKPRQNFRLRVSADGRTPADTVIGRPRTHRVRSGETLLDVARWYDLGYNEIVDANPGIDPWVPPTGATVTLPTSWVLPCCTYEGLVINIPEMRLYSYRRDVDGRTLLVETYPVGLGRVDRRTPRGKFRVRGKTVNPRWDIPESIRQEHIAERGDARTFIAGGDPENPLGKYRFELSIPSYAIHGTNLPWGAGMPVSHGCARLYPEDIAALFPTVPIGTPVEFVYQPVKVGTRADGVFLEAHEDLYKLAQSPVGEALSMLRKRRLARPSRRTVQAALDASHGMPSRLGGG